MTSALELPADFTWRQSIVTDYLECPRRVYLQHVAQVPADYALDGYAAIAGTALHAAIAEVLNGLMAGDLPSREALAEILEESFTEALIEEQDRGASTDPARVATAIERLTTEQLDLAIALRDDPRLAAVDWRGVEEEFSFVDPHGRRFTGTIDAWGVAKQRVSLWGSTGRDRVSLEAGDLIVVDWKTGTETPLDSASRALNVQLAVYRSVLDGPARTFLAALRDLERPKRPKDAEGNGIPRMLEEFNPAYAAAVGLDLADTKALEQCRKRPKDAEGNPIPKRFERENPAWIEATSRPKGPLFHECRINDELVARSIADAIDGARLGLWPAAGAVTGACRTCPYRAHCVTSEAGYGEA